MRQYRNLILILIIVGLAIYLDLPNTPGLPGREIKTHLGLDLVGGVQILLEADLPADQVTNEAMNTATNIVKNRSDALGISETNVQRVGDRRILAEIPGLEDPEKALQTLGGVGLLEFVDMSSISPQDALFYYGQTIQTDFGQTNISPTLTTTSTQPVWHTVMTGTAIDTALATTDQVGAYEVSLLLTKEGGQFFDQYTAEHVGDVLAIVLDKVVVSAPVINARISDGQAVITGKFTYDEANLLAVQLRYGSLPVPLKVVETRSIGPSLGQDSLRKSYIAGAVGAVIVMLFMALYYRLPGLIADLSIIIYALIAFALYRSIPVTLTLPGIAGFLLSTGSALDANILIFERMKEELRRGVSLRQAINQGFTRAWPSIRDSNFATLLTSGVLAWIGSQSGATIVIGFAFTLAVGVMVSLFTAILVTRSFLNLILGSIEIKDFAKWFGI